jgi:dihydrofolate reductase
MIISLIVAADENNGIGYNNQLLCHLSSDLKYFKATTTGHHIVMGRKTYESVGRPLPNRVNMVISRNKDLVLEGCIVKQTLEEAIEYAQQAGETELFITGGGTIYEQSLWLAHKKYITRIHHHFSADTYFPSIPQNFTLTKDEQHEADDKNAYAFSFQVYEKDK